MGKTYFISVPLQSDSAGYRFASIDNRQEMYAMNFRKSLKLALAQRDMKQKELAEKLGMLETSLSQLASQTSCTGATLQKIADAFDMKVSEFVSLGED